MKETYEPCTIDKDLGPCLGFGVFKSTGSSLYRPGEMCIQRCDECNRFENDGEAQAFALKTNLDTLPDKTGLYTDVEFVCYVDEYRKDPERYQKLLESNPMAKYGVVDYKRSDMLSDESIAFTAVVTIDNTPSIDARNRGTGGCNEYYFKHGSNFKAVLQFQDDAEAWWKLHGGENPFEAEDLWIKWYAERREEGTSPREFVREFEEALY
jgi:hypothetical protein